MILTAWNYNGTVYAAKARLKRRIKHVDKAVICLSNSLLRTLGKRGYVGKGTIAFVDIKRIKIPKFGKNVE